MIVNDVRSALYNNVLLVYSWWYKNNKILAVLLDRSL